MSLPLTPDEVSELIKRKEFAKKYKTRSEYQEAVLAKIDDNELLDAPMSVVRQIDKCIRHGYDLCFDPVVPATHAQLMLDVAADRAANKDTRATEILATPDFFHGNQRKE